MTIKEQAEFAFEVVMQSDDDRKIQFARMDSIEQGQQDLFNIIKIRFQKNLDEFEATIAGLKERVDLLERITGIGSRS